MNKGLNMKKKVTSQKTRVKTESAPQPIQVPNESVQKTIESQKNPQAKIELIDPDVFVEAAEYLFLQDRYIKYCCDTINRVKEGRDGTLYGESEELLLFKNLYEADVKERDDLGISWWPRLKNGNWDYESRIFALLFAAELAISDQSLLSAGMISLSVLPDNKNTNNNKI